MECLHVFHQECLEEWLINCKHDGCPSCRAQIIQYEEGGVAAAAGDNNSLDGSSLDEPSSFAFVIMNGLISPLRRARNSIVGSSINLNNEMDDSSIGSNHNPLSLRRVFSAGATESPTTEDRPGLFGVALRRVSSGIYSRLSGTFETQGEQDGHDAETPEMKNLKQPHMLRRTRSEGLPVTPRTNNSSASYLVLGGANDDLDDDLENADIHLDFDLDDSNSSYDNFDSPSRTRGIMRLGMRRPKYDHLRSFREECSSDEESLELEPQNLWRDELDEDDDIEAGGIEMSPRRLPRLPT